jgi:hypothetical protein
LLPLRTLETLTLSPPPPKEYFEGIIDQKQYNRNLFGIGAPQY